MSVPPPHWNLSLIHIYFTSGAIVEVSGNPLFTAVVGTCFAYEGWICATSINAELKDSKKNLPRALMFGRCV